MDRLEKWIAAVVLGFGILVCAVLTISDQIYGIDAWYHIVWEFQSIPITNLVMLGMWLSVFLLFSLVKDKQRSPYFIAALFLLNLTSLRFLEVELDDYIMTFFGMLFMVHFKNNPIGPLNHKTFAMILVAAYMVFYGFFNGGTIGALIAGKTIGHLEQSFNPFTLSYLLPTIYLLAANKMKAEYMGLVVIVLLFAIPKFVLTGLVFYIFALHLDLISKKDSRYNKKIIALLTIVFLGIMAFSVVSGIDRNNEAFEKYCNKETRICTTQDGSHHFGHYFAWKGYVTDNPYEYGFCHCQGDRCLKGQLVCGTPSVKAWKE